MSDHPGDQQSFPVPQYLIGLMVPPDSTEVTRDRTKVMKTYSGLMGPALHPSWVWHHFLLPLVGKGTICCVFKDPPVNLPLLELKEQSCSCSSNIIAGSN